MNLLRPIFPAILIFAYPFAALVFAGTSAGDGALLYRNIAAAVLFKEVLHDIAPVELKPIRFTAQDDQVTVERADRSKAEATGIGYNRVMVIALRNGNATLMHDYLDTAEIVRVFEGRVSKTD